MIIDEPIAIRTLSLKFPTRNRRDELVGEEFPAFCMHLLERLAKHLGEPCTSSLRDVRDILDVLAGRPRVEVLGVHEPRLTREQFDVGLRDAVVVLDAQVRVEFFGEVLARRSARHGVIPFRYILSDERVGELRCLARLEIRLPSTTKDLLVVVLVCILLDLTVGELCPGLDGIRPDIQRIPGLCASGIGLLIRPHLLAIVDRGPGSSDEVARLGDAGILGVSLSLLREREGARVLRRGLLPLLGDRHRLRIHRVHVIALCLSGGISSTQSREQAVGATELGVGPSLRNLPGDRAIWIPRLVIGELLPRLLLRDHALAVRGALIDLDRGSGIHLGALDLGPLGRHGICVHGICIRCLGLFLPEKSLPSTLDEFADAQTQGLDRCEGPLGEHEERVLRRLVPLATRAAQLSNTSRRPGYRTGLHVRPELRRHHLTINAHGAETPLLPSIRRPAERLIVDEGLPRRGQRDSPRLRFRDYLLVGGLLLLRLLNWSRFDFSHRAVLRHTLHGGCVVEFGGTALRVRLTVSSLVDRGPTLRSCTNIRRAAVEFALRSSVVWRLVDRGPTLRSWTDIRRAAVEFTLQSVVLVGRDGRFDVGGE
ncbi:unannotated protein [freshwater metagenome]|uniref:Unannotated protein n=1 Tax=freshwater metagenome TaxID=449393 RepID=A0A6J7PDM4_9ZZZZ